MNVDLSLVMSLDNFRIEGYPITRYQEVTGNLSSSMYTIASFFAGFSGNSVLWLCIFFALCMLFHRAAAVKNSRITKYAATTAPIFSMLHVIGFSINKYNSLVAITDSVMAFMKCLTAFVGISFIFYGVLVIFFQRAMDCGFEYTQIKKLKIFDSDKKAFVLRCIVVFISWLPYLIVYLPGFFPRDTAGQIAQALGDIPLSGHHPVFMTGLFGVFIRAGMLFGSANTGLLLYSLFQMLVIAAAVCFVSMRVISTMLDVQKGSIGEALSIPLQQIARTVKEHGNELSESNRAVISSILPYEQLPELYNPTISDPVKARGIFNEAEFRSDASPYISLWARLFVKYPDTYLEAFLCQTHGYWYPDIDYWLVTREMWQNNYGIHYISNVPTFVNNVFSGVFVFRVFPAISMLISVGFAVWVTVTMALILMIKRKYKMLIVFLPVFLLWLTCIASPVSGMFRYIYGLFLSLPVLISASLQEDKWREEEFK